MELESLEAVASIVISMRAVSIVPKLCVEPLNPLPVIWKSLGPDAPKRELVLIARENTTAPAYDP